MKALYVLHRVSHYFMVWMFVLAGLLTVAGVFMFGMYGLSGYTFEESAAMPYLLGLVALVLIIVAIVFFALSHIFKMSYEIKAKKAEEEAMCQCGCGCTCCNCECEKEEKSDLDAQVEEVMKWKNLYVEGIITEREFIDKRNEILRLSK